jgi:hypothetical protein
VSVTFLVLAAMAWLRPGSSPSAPATERGAFRGALILFAVSGAFVGAVWLMAVPLGWNPDRVLWAGLGTLFGVLTVARPWWFWDNYRARWLRELIGDEATVAIYLALAAMMIWVGLFRDWRFGRR